MASAVTLPFSREECPGGACVSNETNGASALAAASPNPSTKANSATDRISPDSRR